MSSFFGRLKSNTNPSSPSTGNAPAKKDANAPQPTPLEKHLADATGSVRPDGSDKFFGFENFGSTCYCNSIIQCLYYSAPFRESVMNFPSRSPTDIIHKTSDLPRINTATGGANVHGNSLSPTATSPRKVTPTPGTPGTPAPKPEDDKGGNEYRKKLALAAGPVLSMEYDNSKNYGMEESLFTAMKDIFEAIIANRSRIGVVSPHKFLEILRRENEMFRSAMHQDAHEFLNLLLNQVVDNVEHFSKQIEATKDASGAKLDDGPEAAFSSVLNATTGMKGSTSNAGWVHELFEGTLTSETRCLTCENISQRDEAFLDLSVDLEQHSSVTSCLRKFSEEEMLCERNKFHCDKCGGLQEAEKRMKVKRLPRILALHLKRFKYTEDLQRLQKLFHRVVYPYHLRLFNTTDDAEDPDRLYELYAVVVHIGGGPYHGHYVAIIKTQDRGWLMFDDELVEPVDKSFVRNFFGGDPTALHGHPLPGQNPLACAYVLFYQETTLEAVRKEQEAEDLAAEMKASEGVKEAVSVAAVPNGTMRNGLHHTHTAQTPILEESDKFASLDHAATAPTYSPPPQASPQTPGLGLSMMSSNLGFNSKGEKERKAAEKELEKQAKQKRKEVETQRRNTYKKQEEDLKAAIEASKASKTEEDTRTLQSAPNGKENGIMGGSLSRFRPGSMSLRQKPKFWPGKDKSELKDGLGSQDGSGITTESNTPLLGASPDRPDRKNRFSLGRKKSTMLG
ncbi:hypothetical protein LTR04_005277 [Oleoguttula sp. CCFEE 6159]|nr:hypothetical protein LTR04_005277 [Oleoguttula sp. CCFEE 6159]